MDFTIYREIKPQIQSDLDLIAQGHRPDSYSNYPRPQLLYQVVGLDFPYYYRKIDGNSPVPPPTKWRVAVPILEHEFLVTEIFEKMKADPSVFWASVNFDRRSAIEEFVLSRFIDTDPRFSPRPFIKKWSERLSDYEKKEEDILTVLTIGEIEVCTEI